MIKPHTTIYSLLAICLIATSCVWENSIDNPDFLVLDDHIYSYANIPRIIIETDDFKEIRNKENYVPAKLQIYGRSSPQSEVFNIVIRGRGNSSFMMSKFSYKIKFDVPQHFMGMASNKDWDLIANHRDRTFLQNHLTFQLADQLGDEYTPHDQFAELFINRNYIGLFQICEHMEVSKNKINITKSDSSFLIEKTTPFSLTDSNFTTKDGNLFKICYPKNPSPSSILLIKKHINEFESFLKSKSINDLDSLKKWIDIEDFIRYYWIQEFSKNNDGAFRRSIFITWEYGKPIKMGPVWDFDIAYSNRSSANDDYSDWLVRNYGWYKHLFKSSIFKNKVREYWEKHQNTFLHINTQIDTLSPMLSNAANNNFNRWPVLNEEDHWPFFRAYSSYDSATCILKQWIINRHHWINENY